MSAYNLRSSGINSNNIDMVEGSTELSKLEELLKPIENSLTGVKESLANIRLYFEDKIKLQQRTINNLLTRIENLELRLGYREHISLLHERKIDDLEQVSRKVNLKIVGLEVVSNETPQNLMKRITDVYLGNDGLDLQLSDFDRCHPVGPRYRRNGKMYHDVILKMCSWRARDIIYKNRKRFGLFVTADLTTRRKALLTFAKNELEANSCEDDDDDETLGGCSRIGEMVEYVFYDENCKLKLKSRSGKYFMFSSEEEFYSIISRLDYEQLSPNFLLDEGSSETFY